MSLISRFRIISISVWLAALPAGALAEIGQDTHLQETGEVRIEVDRQVFEEFARMFELGYPPATIMMHAVSTGMSINDVLYIAIKSDPERAEEYYDTAASLLPALPGWVCQAKDDRTRYTQEVDVSDLGERPGVRQVAQRYFDADKRVVPFPAWTEGRVHMEASVEELAGLISDEQWYVAGDNDGSPLSAPNRPIFISLYKHNNDIIVDSGVERIRRAREQGIDRLPVVLIYNNELQRPISSYSDDVTLAELANDFYGQGVELTAVPEWRVGDHHKRATMDELREIVGVLDRDDFPPERWDAIEQEFRANNMEPEHPLLLTLVRSGQGRAWINDPAKVAVASELGIQELPVVIFYHRIDRQACGQPSSCEDVLCDAATAAGASQAVCSRSGQQTARAGDGTSDNDSEAATPVAFNLDPRLYQGLGYTQNQCAS